MENTVRELPPEPSALKKAWNRISNLDIFVKLFLAAMLLILIAIPIITTQQTNMFSNAARSRNTTVVSFQSTPTGAEIWLDYVYRGPTPLIINVSTKGSHHIGFYKYNYNHNTALESNFTLGTSPVVISGNMTTGQITASLLQSSALAPVYVPVITPIPTLNPTPMSTLAPIPTLAPTIAPAPVPTVAPVSGGMRPISLVMYGNHDTTTDNRIIAAKPTYLIDNTPHGPWKGACVASKFKAAGINVFSYITAGYENGYSESIPNDLASNISYIDSIAANDTGTYGIFLDEVDSDPNSSLYPANGSTFKWNYLQQISQEAHNKGLKLMCNTGMDSWNDTLMNYCDYLMSTEDYQGAALTAPQTKWASRVVVLSEYVTDANTAINYTNKATSLGLLAAYAGPYQGLPTWFETYVAGVPTR